ncbi:MAG: radical SAM protein, partial [Deltaproteobacteria bacterium]
HANLFPDETINLSGVDYLVLGEGEFAFKELLDNLKSQKRLEKVPGLVIKSKVNGVVNTGPHRVIDDLDDIPFPARNLVPYEKYSSLLTRGRVATTMITSRGCPFKCTFCDRPHLGKKFRARSPQNVVDEMEECVNMGISEFLIYDDTFTVDKKRVISICDEIVRRKLDIGFDIRARVDTVNADVLRALKRAGCQGIHYGVEAATDKILKVLNKGITIEQVREVFKLTKKHKIPILAYFMIGNPNETRSDIETTFRIMKQLKPDYVHVTIFTPFPGTKIYLDGLRSGMIKNDFWREFAKNPVMGFEIPVWEEYFKRKELYEMIVKVYRDFYLRPSYVLSRIVKIKSRHEFMKKMKAGFSVLFLKKGR